MSSQGVWSPAPPPPAEGADWSGRPRYAPGDWPALLWRERRLMVLVFLGIFLTGAAVALTIKRSYPAHSSVLVRLGQEYVYEPLTGDAARGAVPEGQQVLQSERDILGSDALKEEVVNHLGYGKLYPEGARAFAAAGTETRRRMVDRAVVAIRRSLKIETAPDTPVIRLTYADTDPERAALVLNTLLSDYLVYRRKILLDPTAAALDQQKRSFQDRLDQADAAYEDFLSHNRIGDFEAEKTSLSQLQAQIEQQQYATAAQLKERLGRMAGLDAGLSQVAPQVDLYRDADNTANAKLLDLEIQREAALAKYQPGAQPVRALDAQIAQLDAAISQGRAKGEGVLRTGANPVYQTLQTEKLQLVAEISALRQSLAALQDQDAELTERRLRLAGLEPRFDALNRDRDVLQANVKDFTVKEEQSQATQEISASTNDNIRIVEWATPPTEGVSLRNPILAVSFLFAIFSAVCAGTLRVLLRPGLPTPATAARTLELPVLGVAAMKA
jgi:uncharacterized protein involved in exopolysaccharide biosynthesis